MKKKMLFVFNPFSGKAQIKNNLVQIVDIFTKNDYDVVVHPTQDGDDCYQYIKENAEKFDIVVSSGGDGTFKETAQAMIESCSDKAFGYIPSGTVNDLAYSLNIPKDMIKAAKVITTGKPFETDIGRFNDKDYFCYIAAFGAFTDVSHTTPQHSKNMFGHLAYLMEGVKKLGSINSYKMRVETKQETIEGDFIVGIVSNTFSIGGYRNIGEFKTVLDDGLFEVTLIKTPNSPIELQSILSSLIRQDLEDDSLIYFKTQRVSFFCDEPINWTLDGEDGGTLEKVTITNVNKAIKVLVPQE